MERSLTVLDRLLEPEQSGSSAGPRPSAVDSILRDLQILINTRRQNTLVDTEEPQIAKEFEYCRRSILRFGVPDPTQCGNLNNTSEQEKVCNWLKEAIGLFEPRLRNVSIRIIPAPNESRILHFQVEATVEIVSERIAFNMALQRDIGQFTVSSDEQL
jgi:type VI secretion system lysozyme-like protein